YDVTPETPGQISETDLARLDATNRELERRVFDLGSLVGPRPLPSVAAHPLGVPALPPGARVTGVGVNGPVVEGLEGCVQDAVKWLRGAKTGDVKGVLNHPDLPNRPVDMVYGTEKFGLRHIDDNHGSDADKLPAIWNDLKLASDSRYRSVLKNDTWRAVVP